MKRSKRRLPVPQHEFLFRATAFNLAPKPDWTATESPANEPRQTAPAVPPNPRKRVCSLLKTPNENPLIHSVSVLAMSSAWTASRAALSASAIVPPLSP